MRAAVALATWLGYSVIIAGCAQQPVGIIEANDRTIASTPSCSALTTAEIERLTGAHVMRVETLPVAAQFCRFRLSDGQWFDVILTPVPGVELFTHAACEDTQNGPPHNVVHHPHCTALAGRCWAHVQSAAWFGMPTDTMKRLPEAIVGKLALAAGAKIVD